MAVLLNCGESAAQLLAQLIDQAAFAHPRLAIDQCQAGKTAGRSEDRPGGLQQGLQLSLAAYHLAAEQLLIQAGFFFQQQRDRHRLSLAFELHWRQRLEGISRLQ